MIDQNEQNTSAAISCSQEPQMDSYIQGLLETYIYHQFETYMYHQGNKYPMPHIPPLDNGIWSRSHMLHGTATHSCCLMVLASSQQCCGLFLRCGASFLQVSHSSSSLYQASLLFYPFSSASNHLPPWYCPVSQIKLQT